MNAYWRYTDKIMDLKEYDNNKNSKAYKTFYYRYMRIQFYLNFVTNIQSKLECALEYENNNDWNKQYSDDLFQVGYKNNPYNKNMQSDLIKIKEVRKKVKEEMNLKKDYNFINEEAALHEFLQLFSILECYLQDLYCEIINNDRAKFSKKLKLSTTDEKAILDKLACGEELNGKMREEIFENSIKNHLMKNAVELLEVILKSLPKNLMEEFKMDIQYNKYIEFLNKMRELRNLHIHKLGIKDGKYQNVDSMYTTNPLRGSLHHLVPKLDNLVVENILSTS